jgi:methylase of polypeptide subunit release factors
MADPDFHASGSSSKQLRSSGTRGFLAREIGHRQAREVSTQLAMLQYQEIRIEEDYQGIKRFVIAFSPRQS